jgi:hypothetical protein
MANKTFGLLGPLIHPEHYSKPSPVEAGSSEEWYAFMLAMLRREDARSRWWTPDPQTLH